MSSLYHCSPTSIEGMASGSVQIAGLLRAPGYGAPVTQKLVRSLPGCLRDIWAREGLRGLYKGSLPSIMKAAPAAAATFTAYELFMRILLEHVDVDKKD